MTVRERLATAVEREGEVLAAVRARGATADRYGQAMLSEQMRTALVEADRSRGSRSLLRWSADLLVIRGELGVFLVDVKAGRTDTRNYAIEHAAIEAAVVESDLAPVLIVWPDWRVSHALNVWEAPWEEGPPLPYRTPYRLIDKGDVYTHPFDAMFGEPA